MAAVPLPPALEDRLVALAGRVRRVRVLRGAGGLAVAVLLSAAAVVLLDALLDLSVAARCLLQLGWLALAGLLVWRLIFHPLRAEVTLDEIARLVEHQFPGLGERLLTVVELRGEAGPANGSPQLIASLARETELRTRSMDFARVAPARPAGWVAAVAGLAFAAAVVAAVVVPGAGERLRRVAAPWYRPAVVAPFRVVVSSGDPVVRRGDPVTLSAYVERTEPNGPVPESAVLVFRDGPGSPERKLPMAGDATTGFHVTRPAVTADFEYRVEAGPAASGWHTVTAADPVELTDQTTVEIAPPPYAAVAVPKVTVSGLSELAGLQHSTAAITLRFTRPAATALLEWRPEGSGPAELVPIRLDPSATGGTATFRLRQNGTLRVVLVNETGLRKLRTEVPVPVRIIPDAPPRFEQVAGVSPQPRTVRPGERVPINFAATDDVAVDAAELEYAVGQDDATAARIPIPLTGAGTPRAEGRYVFDLAGKGAEGESVRFRVRVADNRRLDDPPLTPQEAVYPLAGWAELKLSASAPPLEYQEILGRRDHIRDALAAAQKEVKETAAETEKLRADTAKTGAFAPDQTVRLGATRDRVKRAADLLHDAARDAALTPELRPLAAAARDIADRPVKAADEALYKAGSDAPADREAAFAAADGYLAEASGRIEDLLRHNDRAAQDRLDRRRLDDLAADQTTLAERAKGSDTPGQSLAKVQQDLIERLQRLLAESDPLRRGTEVAGGREARRLAADAQALAGMLGDLNRAARELTAEVRKELLDGLVRLQSALAEKAAGMLARADTPARLAGMSAPKPDGFRRVAGLIADGKTVEALTEAEKLAGELDALAATFEKAAAQRTDPKEAARQLARWQDDLRARLEAATDKGKVPFDRVSDPAKAAFRAEQAALRKAADGLTLPASPDVIAARDAASAHLGKAVESLDAEGGNASVAMKAAAEALDRLAGKTPAVADRLAATRPELDRLRGEQESILVQAEQATRGADPVRKLAGLHERQLKAAERLAALDLPGLEPRQARAVAALRAAAGDLKDGLPYDAAASQAWARRELDRLKQALDRTPPTDDQADELARKQKAVADALAALGDQPAAKQLEPLAAAQQEVQRLIEGLQAPEAPMHLHDAQQAVKAAEAGFRDKSGPDELKKRARAAADTLAKLADRLAGAEPDADRVRRLAENRARAAEDAKKLAGTPYNPIASGAAKRQLGYEVEELNHTRVGPAGQPLKKKVLDLYTQLRNATEPDRQAGPQKQLADALEALAGKTADVAELSAGRPRGDNPPAAHAVDAYLPTKPLADSLRDLAAQQRAVRDRVAGIPGELARRTRPADDDPLAALERRQRDLAAGIAELARTLAAEKDPTSAEAATPAADAARQGADRMRIGQVRLAREAVEQAVGRLRQLAAAAGTRPWGRTAAELAEKQEAILGELKALLDNPAAAAARQKARQQELAGVAGGLAGMLEQAGANAGPQPAGRALSAAGELVRTARKMLDEAAGKVGPEADRLRAGAEKAVADAAAKAAGAAGDPSPPEADAGAATAGEAVRQAAAAMRQAADQLTSQGDRAAAERAMRQAAAALTRAGKALGGTDTPPPDGPPSPGRVSGGNPGTQSGPTTATEFPPELIEKWGRAWGDLPGEVRAKVLQDLRAKYGEDYARAIKLYFEQLAERK